MKLKGRSGPRGSLVKEATLKQMKPCLAAEGKIRVLMELDSEIGEFIPVIAKMYPSGVVNYVRKKNILTLTIYDRIINLYPSGKISMNKTRNVEESFEIVGEFMDRINRAHRFRGHQPHRPHGYKQMLAI